MGRSVVGFHESVLLPLVLVCLTDSIEAVPNKGYIMLKQEREATRRR